jgi:hypothetical protein
LAIPAFFLLRYWFIRKLGKENKRLEEELHRMKEMRKHRGFHVEQEVFDPSEETIEEEGIPSSPVIYEEDVEDNQVSP